MKATVICVDINEESNNETVKHIQDTDGVAFGYEIIFIHACSQLEEKKIALWISFRSAVFLQKYYCRYKCDVSRKEHVEELANKIQSEVGDVNILVNNAGVLYCRPFVQWTPNQIEQVVQTNLMGNKSRWIKKFDLRHFIYWLI